MQSLSTNVITFLAYLTVVGQILSAGLLLVLILAKIQPKKNPFDGGLSKKVLIFINQYYILAILLISTVATLGSLTFSEILGFNPCKLCWEQRIFMYPLVIISGVALFINDNKVTKYILPLSIIGFLIATYHVLLQFYPEILKCSDEVAKCSTRQFATFGYITIPVMSMTAFLLLILISLLHIISKKK